MIWLNEQFSDGLTDPYIDFFRWGFPFATAYKYHAHVSAAHEFGGHRCFILEHRDAIRTG